MLVELRRLAATDLTAAQICRQLGSFAATHDFQRPSYQTVRRLVQRERLVRALPSVAEPLVEGWLRARSPQSAVDEAFRRAEQRATARARIEAERAWRPAADTHRPGKSLK